MPSSRAPWWIYLVAAVFALTFCFNLWNWAFGPADAGFRTESSYLYATNLTVGAVDPGGPFDKAGVRVGDIIVGADGYPVKTAMDWFAVRMGFEVGRPVELKVLRGDEKLNLQFIITSPAWRTWELKSNLPEFTSHFAQLIGLLLAMFVVFSHPEQIAARLAGLIFAMAAVINSSPPSGWAAALHTFPLALQLPVSLAAYSLSLTGVVWFAFFALFPRPAFTRRWPWALLLVSSVFLLPRIGWWMGALYAPQLILGLSPEYVSWPIVVAIGQYLGGIVLLLRNYFRAEDIDVRRRLRVLLVSTCVGLPTGVAWFFGTPLMAFAGGLVILIFPLGFVYAVLWHRLFDIKVIIRQGLRYALARRVLIPAVPLWGGILLVDLVIHGNEPPVRVLRERGWVYVVFGVLALVAQSQRRRWRAALDRHFFRERYDAQRLMREVVEEVGRARSFQAVAPSVVARIEVALHPKFVALMVREPGQASYRTAAAAPSGHAPPPLPAESKLIALTRVLGKPLEVSLSETGWLKQQLPPEEADFLLQAQIDLLVPITALPEGTDGLLVLGAKRSEDPYAREDRDLLMAIAASLGLLLEKPAAGPLAERISEVFRECPQCGACYDSGSARCEQEGAALTPVRLPRVLAGRYRLERRRGQGGMGEVYEALDTALERRVAAKVIRQDLVGSAEAAERFRREARAVAGFAHPNVVTVYDFGIAGGTRAFLVMELLKGLTLREELRRCERLAAPRTVEILRGICDAVEAAHHRQLVHRDLKPENIILAQSDSGETPKVLDFGVAKFLPAASEEKLETATGWLLGTMRYMAPEQLRGRPVASAWDLWALSVMSYELLTGTHPFAGMTPAECNVAVLSGHFTPVAVHLPDAPPRWQEFFSRALSPNITERPPTARAFFSQLGSSIL